MSEPDNMPLPGTVFSPRQVRVLKIVVIAMGVLLVVGFLFVIGVIAYQASNLGQGKDLGQGKNLGQDKAAPPPATALPGNETELAIPQGATVVSMALDGDRLALHLNSSAGPEIVVIDITTGKFISRIRLNANKP